MREELLRQEVFKLAREIERYGISIEFVRFGVDDYGQPDEDKNVEMATVQGIYHTTKGYINRTITDGGMNVPFGQPMLMCLYADAKVINVEDVVTKDGVELYRIVGKTDIGGFHIVMDFSLEEVHRGNSI